MQAMEALMAERDKNGKFKSMQDFLERCDNRIVNKKQLESLIAAGAFDSIHPNRAELFSNVEIMTRYAATLNDDKASGQGSLLMGSATEALKLKASTPWDDLTKLQNEQKAIGFYLTAHPLDSFKALLERVGVLPSTALMDAARATLIKLAGIPVQYKERTAKTGSKYAFATLTDAHGPFEVMIFSEVLASARELLQGTAPLVCKISIQTRNEETRLILQGVETIDALLAREGQGICIHVGDEKAMKHIHVLVQGMPKGKSRIQLDVPVGGEMDALMELPGAYAITAQDRYKIQQIPGVSGFVEI